MHLCRRGIIVGQESLAWLATLSLGIFFLQASPVSARDPSVADDANTPVSLEFETSAFDGVHEGYVTLVWNKSPDAAAYRVTDTDGDTVYQGEFNQAFVSGLPNGTHKFSLVALNDRGQLLDIGVPIATVNVSHWPMWQAMTSLGIGAVVFVLLIGVIVHGTVAASKDQFNVGNSNAGNSNVGNSNAEERV